MSHEPCNYHEDVDLFREALSYTQQVQGQLRPVLREADYTAFDLKRAFEIVTKLAAALQ